MGDLRVRAGRRVITVAHAEKVLFASPGITKLDLVEYYRSVAPWMAVHVRDRPLMLGRYPEGIETNGFYQKRLPPSFPDWIARTSVPKVHGGTVTQAVGGGSADLVGLAAQACVSFHVWQSRKDRLELPDRIVLDLDPATGDFGIVRRVAVMLRSLLEEIGLVPYVKTTGSRGVHVVSPILRRLDFDQVRGIVRTVADVLEQRAPDLVTSEPRKRARKGRLYLDIMRNAYGQTAAAPYSVRALPGAPVATPLTWTELDDADMTSQYFTLGKVPGRLAAEGDPWADMHRYRRSLAAARVRLDAITGHPAPG